MQITITLDTTKLTDEDRAVLAALTGGAAHTEAAKPEKAAPAAKPAAAPKSTPKAEKAVEEAESAVDEPVEDEPADAEGGTMEDAVALATKLVSAGQAAKVKAALADAGAKRVSELKDEDIASFIAALS